MTRAVSWTGLSALIVPVGGLLVQPVLARALGTEGRGEFAAAMAPAVLATSVATLGLPEALTYYIARDAANLRRMLVLALAASTTMGLLSLVAVLALAPLLAGGDAGLAWLIVLAMLCSLPLLAVGAVRGAAIGRQLYRLSALESVANAVARVVIFVVLWLTGTLTPWSAVVVTCATQVLAALVYVRALRTPREVQSPSTWRRSLQDLFSYGGRIWFGAVAAMLLARTSQIIMVPLSSARELGLYSVVLTVSDIPVLLAFSVAKAVSGVNAQSADWGRVAKSARIVLLVTAVSCLAIGGSMPLWLTPLFGSQFGAALVPTLFGLAGATIAAPAYVMASGLSSSGRPGLRSTAYVVALVVNVVVFILLVPGYGAGGAVAAGVVTSISLLAVLSVFTRRLSGVRVIDFLIVSKEDIRSLTAVALGVARRSLRRPR